MAACAFDDDNNEGAEDLFLLLAWRRVTVLLDEDAKNRSAIGNVTGRTAAKLRGCCILLLQLLAIKSPRLTAKEEMKGSMMMILILSVWCVWWWVDMVVFWIFVPFFVLSNLYFEFKYDFQRLCDNIC